MRFLTNKWLRWLSVVLVFITIIPVNIVSGQASHAEVFIEPQDDSKSDDPKNYVPLSHLKQEIDVIVELKTDPVSKYSQQQLQRKQRSFGVAAQSTGAVIRHQYDTVFHGFALTVPADAVEDLLSIPEVEAIYPDRQVQLLTDPNELSITAAFSEIVNETGVAHFWEQGYRGKGITIGLIDTGVDYNHPDLRGAFNSSYKGYNFVRKDSGSDPRPRDLKQETHGTHVAGIIAGRQARAGGVIGIAPEAELLAYRVLDSEGVGQESAAIAAVERAVADGVDIINLSLGVETKDNELTPLAKTVNNAVRSGVVVVAANGNKGPKTFTAHSPATAELAIAVGASDGRTAIADFSSRGPSLPNLRIKPDLSAPGVAIRSTVPGDAYAVSSGTSMASPYISGVTALLLQRYGSNYHHSEKPAFVKAHLMNNTERFEGYLFTEQGAGHVNLRKVENAQSIVMADRNGSISFGKLTPGTSVTRTIHIHSIIHEEQQYDIRTHMSGSVQLTVHNGKSDLRVPANTSTAVNIVAHVPTHSSPGTYEGVVSFTERTTKHTINVPVIVFVPGEELDYPPGIAMKRVSGGNRYTTSLALSSHVKDRSLDTVILASGRDFPDALAGGTLVNALNGTILLVDSRAPQLDHNLTQTIQRVLKDKGKIVILGGIQAIPTRIEQQLIHRFNDRFTVMRIAGNNRQETATNIASYVTNQPEHVFIVNGNHFADAMSIVPYANHAKTPILLNRSTERLDTVVAEYLNNHRVHKVTLIGGTQVLNESIVNQLRREGYTVERISGKDRFLTAFEVMKRYYPKATQWAIANGLNFPDALSASRLTHDHNMPILLSRPDRLSPDIEHYMYKHRIDRLFFIGGSSVLHDDLLGF